MMDTPYKGADRASLGDHADLVDREDWHQDVNTQREEHEECNSYLPKNNLRVSEQENKK
mgnify:CR=1 FL=1